MDLCSDIRDIFTEYFTLYSFEPKKYCNLLKLCDSFEKQYKEYGNKVFMKESKNMIEIKRKLNILKKELRESNNYHNSNLQHWSDNGLNHFKMYSSGSNGINNSSFDKHANKKYKVLLANDIRRLTQEQKKGIASILSKAFLDLNDNTMEIDVNKIPNCQLKELEKYVMQCIKTNSGLIISNNNNLIHEKINGNINNYFLLQKADSTMNSMNQEIQSEKEKNDNNTSNRQAVFSDSDSMLSDDSDSDSDSDID